MSPSFRKRFTFYANKNNRQDLLVKCDCVVLFLVIKKIKAIFFIFPRMKNLHSKNHATEVILVGRFGKCQSIKKVGDRRFVEGLYQVLFSFIALPAGMLFTKRNKNSA